MSETTNMTRRTVNRLLAALPFALGACAAHGERALAGRPDHHTANGFQNPPGSPEGGGDFGDWMSFFWRNTNRGDDVTLPEGYVLPRDQVLAGLETDGDRQIGRAHV